MHMYVKILSNESMQEPRPIHSHLSAADQKPTTLQDLLQSPEVGEPLRKTGSTAGPSDQYVAEGCSFNWWRLS